MLALSPAVETSAEYSNSGHKIAATCSYNVFVVKNVRQFDGILLVRYLCGVFEVA